MSLDKILPAAKAWAALIGAVVTALLGTVGPDSTLGQVLTAVAAVATAITVYRVPNKRKAHRVVVGDLRLEGPITEFIRDAAREEIEQDRRWRQASGD